MMTDYFFQHKRLLLPFLIFISLVVFLYHQLNQQPTTHLRPSQVQYLPQFELPNTFDLQQTITTQQILGKTALVHIWSHWCTECTITHPLLMQIKKQGYQIHGILYRSDAHTVKNWLQIQGNPYTYLILDNGSLTTSLGVKGTPETFLIDATGHIILHYRGALTHHIWQEHFQPMYEQATHSTQIKK
ncbi:MAG: redoxin family protein [Endozoicomonadaceae bacterium]|nr:redoxin family protein [Endozoicomonadaceae bacterium]